MENTPMILHIDLGNQSLTNWLRDNKYVVYSELVRFCEKMISEDLDMLQAIMVSNLADNIVFVLKKETIHITLRKAMEYFLSEEEFEKCAKIRDLQILIEKIQNESKDIKNSSGTKRASKRNG
jgi:hypothetical protein